MIEDILARCNDRQERWYLPELTRIKAELMLKQTKGLPAAEAAFREAMDIATHQGARSWELRCAIGLARFRLGQGRDAEALEVLETVCRPLTEGSRTADMREARGLIAQLRN
ncbi:putative ATPase [Bradyrhizobium diazoefficiens]